MYSIAELQEVVARCRARHNEGLPPAKMDIRLLLQMAEQARERDDRPIPPEVLFVIEKFKRYVKDDPQ